MAQPTGPRSPGGIGDQYTPVTIAGGTTSLMGATGFGALLGFTAAELSGTTTSFRMHDGTAAGASNCLTSLITLAANQSCSDWYGPQGLSVATGVYIERVAGGSTEIVFYGI